MELNELKKAAGIHLKARGLKPTTQRGMDFILAFYIGHYVDPEKIPPYVATCLMSGRFKELVDMGDGE